MKSEQRINSLLKKYQQAPNFPLNDWREDSVSQHALMNLWDELFKTAAGQRANQYEAIGEIAVRPERHVYDIALTDRTRRVSITPCEEGGTFLLVGSDATDGYRPDLIHLGHLPDRSWLELSTDLEMNRLICCFEMIRHYTHAAIQTPDDAERLDQTYINTYKDYFGFPDFDPFAPPPEDDDDDLED